MRRLCVCLSRVFFPAIFLTLFASAQDLPKAELFGGYSYLHVDTQGISGSSLVAYCTSIMGGACPATFQVHPGFNGFNVSGQMNVNQWLGVKADFAGHYGNLITANFMSTPPFTPLNLSTPNQHIYDFLFGPVVSRRAPSYTIFGHGLLGGEHVGFGNFQLSGGAPLTLPGPSSQTSFAFALGAGLDLKVNHHLSVRAGQFDYQFVDSPANGHNHQNDFRFSAGVVFGFGGK
jgi:opacity protein-like surface antigen